MKTFHGRVHGNTIELTEAPQLADGQQVEVRVKAVSAGTRWGENLRRCAGALAEEWTDEDDQILQQIHAERAQDARREVQG